MSRPVPILTRLACDCREDDQELLSFILNATSHAEANIAVNLFAERSSERAAVAAINAREILRELPTSPFSMGIEIGMLARTANLKPGRDGYKRHYEDDGGPYEITLVGDGNLCFDIQLSEGGDTIFLKPPTPTQDLVTPEALDLLLKHDTMLTEIVELTHAMGVVFNPSFYLSLDDWQREHAEDMLRDIGSLF